jgi:hypothetical protein
MKPAGAEINGPRRRIPWAPLLLGLLALLDLRTEIQLLLDHFTWTSLSVIPLQHPLAVMVLVLLPSMLRRYR